MHTLGTQTALEGNGAGIQLTFPGMGQQNQDVNTALSPPEHRNSTGIPPAHHRGYTWPSFNSTQPHRAATEESDWGSVELPIQDCRERLARWMVNCSNWNYAVTPRCALLHLFKKPDTNANHYLENISKSWIHKTPLPHLTLPSAWMWRIICLSSWQIRKTLVLSSLSPRWSFWSVLRTPKSDLSYKQQSNQMHSFPM